MTDHRPLSHCVSLRLPVLPLFIMNPRQVDPQVAIRSVKSLACLFQSLEELQQEFSGKLCIMYGEIPSILSSIHSQKSIQTIVETRDYTPFALQRQQTISQWCHEHDVQHVLMDDLYFFPPGTIRNKSGKVFQKFTPFYRVISEKQIDAPIGKPKGTFVSVTTRYSVSLKPLYQKLSPTQPDWKKEKRKYQGGRKEGLYLLKNLSLNYKKDSFEKSGLSVHHHYGTISVRESYTRAQQLIQTKKIMVLKEFQRQLFWRDFYGNIMAFFKELYHVNPLQFQSPPLLSSKKKKIFELWCQGNTGIPIIDASMRQLNQEGFMPNRMRMIVASWLIKDMKVPWRYGERYFANHLLDYDLTQNMMNWIWVASVLPFASAPFRRFSTTHVLPENDPYLTRWLSIN